MALEMCELLQNDFHVNEKHLQVRIGIGLIVAGVVNQNKFIYDLWGDTVNIASRITSEGTLAWYKWMQTPIGACSIALISRSRRRFTSKVKAVP